MRIGKKGLEAVVLCLLGCLLLVKTAYASPAEEETQSLPYVAMTVEESIPGMVKYNREMVFKIQIQASRQIKANLIMEAAVGEQKVSYYERELELVQGSQTVRQNLFLDKGLTSVFFRLEDEEGTLLAQKEYSISLRAASEETPVLFAAVISDGEDPLKAFDGLSVNGVYETTIQTTALSLSQLPQNKDGLEMLDIVFIEQCDTSGMTAKQKEGILQWTKEGGRLIVGTGAYGTGTTAFLEDLLSEKEASLEREWTGFGCLSEADFIYSENKQEAFLYFAEIEEGILYSNENGNPMVQFQNYGAGRIVLCSYSLVDFCNYLEEYQNQYQLGLPTLSEWTSQILDEDFIDQEVVTGGYWAERYDDLYKTVSGTATDKIPQIGKYIVLLSVYVILIGPGLYFLLKKLKKQSFFQSAVVITAVIFALLVFFLGQDTRYDKPFIIYSRILENDGGTERQTLVFNVRSPFIQQYQLNIGGDSQVELIHESAQFQASSSISSDQVQLRRTEEGTELLFQDIAAFSPRLFRLSKETEKTGSFTCEVQYYDGEFSGYVTNSSQMPIENAALLMGSHYVCLGTLSPGQTVELSGLMVNDTLWEYGYGAEAIVRQRSSGMGAEQRNRRELLDYFISSWKDAGEEGAVLLGFQENGPGEVIGGTECDLSGITLYVQKIDCSREQDGLEYRDQLYHIAWTEEGHTSDDNRISYSEITEISYYLGSEETVSSLKFQERTVRSQVGAFENFQGKIYFYNYNKRQYEEISIDQVLEGSQLLPYTSDHNILRVKYVQDNYSGWEYGILLPYLSVTGRD